MSVQLLRLSVPARGRVDTLFHHQRQLKTQHELNAFSAVSGGKLSGRIVPILDL